MEDRSMFVLGGHTHRCCAEALTAGRRASPDCLALAPLLVTHRPTLEHRACVATPSHTESAPQQSRTELCPVAARRRAVLPPGWAGAARVCVRRLSYALLCQHLPRGAARAETRFGGAPCGTVGVLCAPPPLGQQHTDTARARGEPQPIPPYGVRSTAIGGARVRARGAPPPGSSSACQARANILRVWDADVEREADDPRHLVAEAVAVVDARLADRAVDGRVEPLPDDDRLAKQHPLQARHVGPRVAVREGRLEVDNVKVPADERAHLNRLRARARGGTASRARREPCVREEEEALGCREREGCAQPSRRAARRN
eukprot:893026-Prymnesium_polylepis.1